MELQSAESVFRAVWVAPSIILSLGITRLCSDMVLLFRSSRQKPVDWITQVWAACIFIWQIQYLWAIIELPSLIRIWTLPEFVGLLALSLALFFAGAFVLPNQEQVDRGIWHPQGALLAVSIYGILAVIVDVWMFKVSLFELGTILMMNVALVPLVFLMTEIRWKQIVITLVNLLLTLCAAWIESPKSY